MKSDELKNERWKVYLIAGDDGLFNISSTNSGIDKNKYTAFAFGLGLTRLAMMKYKIDDIRILNSGDLRFLKEFK